MPKKPPKDAERNERHDALEVLRDECARSRLDVGLRQCRTIREGEAKDEGPEFVADADADERKVKALLKRLGDILETWAEGFDLLGQVAPPASEWQRSRLIAAQVLLDRCEWKWITETSATLLADGGEFLEPRPIDSTTFQRVVPNIRLAINEVCRVLLRGRVAGRGSRRAPIGHLVWLGIAADFQARHDRRKPNGEEMAQMLEMHPSTFSRSIGRTKEWKKFLADGVRDRRQT
jgi:hypothetical protein